jgi:hypothetical protein
VNPRAASGGGAWRRRAATVPAVLWLHRTWSQHCYGFLNGCFVILKLFNVIFVFFCNLYFVNMEAKKKRKEKKRNIVKVYVCLYFFYVCY